MKKLAMTAAFLAAIVTPAHAGNLLTAPADDVVVNDDDPFIVAAPSANTGLIVAGVLGLIALAAASSTN